MTIKRLFEGHNLTCVRGGRVVFERLSFGLNPGDLLRLSGPNGAGKSSLLRVMTGALPVATGDVLWDGQDLLEKGWMTHARRFSYLPPDDHSLKTSETVSENLRFWAEFCGGGAVGPALSFMKVTHLKDVPVRRLSAGQKRRVSLARALMRNVRLWLLDEPLAGLDDDGVQLLNDALHAHAEQGGIAVVASQIDVPGARSLAL